VQRDPAVSLEVPDRPDVGRPGLSSPLSPSHSRMLQLGAAPALGTFHDRPAPSAPPANASVTPSVEVRRVPTKMLGWVHYQVWVDGQFVHTGWSRADYWNEEDTRDSADVYAERHRPTSRADAREMLTPPGLHLVR
jgi:hypothetical protein